jgi:ferrochelatase
MSVGVLLLNMGGPNSLDEVELFLKNMFNDKNILPLGSFFRKLVSSMIIRKRLCEAQENYKTLGGCSPLTKISESLAKKLENKLQIPVRLAMRYVPPFANLALEEFKNRGIKKIILFSMYPHYSTTTTLSSIEDVEDHLQKLNYSPNLEIIDSYYDDFEYIKIQANLIKETLAKRDPKEFELIVSAHGLPMSVIFAGDPYEKQVNANFSALKIYLKTIGIEFKSTRLAYQSKVGKDEWLEPSLGDVLRHPESLKSIIFPISFTIDNSETIYELGMEHLEIAKKIGYKEYLVTKCPNDRDDFVEFISNKIEEKLKNS